VSEEVFGHSTIALIRLLMMYELCGYPKAMPRKGTTEPRDYTVRDEAG
jgi:hypothetical protein